MSQKIIEVSAQAAPSGKISGEISLGKLTAEQAELSIVEPKAVAYSKSVLLDDLVNEHFGYYNILYKLWKVIPDNAPTYYRETAKYRLISTNSRTCRVTTAGFDCFPRPMFFKNFDASGNLLSIWDFEDDTWNCDANDQRYKVRAIEAKPYEEANLIEIKVPQRRVYECDDD